MPPTIPPPTNGAATTKDERASGCAGCRYFFRPPDALKIGMTLTQGECRLFPPGLTTNTVPMPGRISGQLTLQQIKATGFPVVEGEWFCWHGRPMLDPPPAPAARPPLSVVQS